MLKPSNPSSNAKKRSPKIQALVFLILGVLLYVGAQFILAGDSRTPSLSIGSKNFTESAILGEYYAQTLEKAGFRVERKFNLGGTLIAHEALKRGQIDVYPEYTGTGLLDVLHQSPPQDFDTAWTKLSIAYRQRWNLIWLEPSQANNANGIVMLKNTANRLGIQNLSQLSTLAPKLRLGSIPEFEERPDGLPGLRTAYGGFRFKNVRLYDNGLKYQILRDRRIDATVAFTTDGALSDPKMTLLEDDRHFWPDYRVAPVIRAETLKKFPRLKPLLNFASSRLDTDTLRLLNAQVDLKHRDYKKVVTEFLQHPSQYRMSESRANSALSQGAP